MTVMVNDTCMGYEPSEIPGVCKWCSKYYNEHWPRPEEPNRHPDVWNVPGDLNRG